MISWHPVKFVPNNQKFSVVIPSWNNIEMLKICVESIRKNSAFEHQIIIHVNEGVDGTLEWVKNQRFDYTHSKDNVGVCWAMNACRALVRTQYLLFLNDDMYVLPNWDLELWKEIEQLGTKFFFLSSTAIEPLKSPHPGVLAPYNFGYSPETFKENDLLKSYENITGEDWSGSTWPPNVVHIDVWDLVGGYSIEYYPGLYSDPDFSMKLYEAGVRIFKGLDKSRVYHFGSKSTKRITLNNGSKQFLSKWGITSATFTKYLLRRGLPFCEEKPIGSDAVPKRVLLRSALKRFLWNFSGTGKSAGKFSYNKK